MNKMFRKKSKFNSGNKDNTIELCLGSVEEKSNKYRNSETLLKQFDRRGKEREEREIVHSPKAAFLLP